MMLIQQIDLIKSEATLAFRRMESLAPTGRDGCEFEEALWQLEKVKDSVTGMYEALDAFVCEAKIAMKALEKVGEVIKTKADNPPISKLCSCPLMKALAMLTPEQLLLRKTGIGGSDAAAIVGLGKYSTPLSVYLDKTTDGVKENTEVMTRGNVLEPFVQSLFERKTGWKVQNNLQTQRNSDHPFMLANLDGLLPSERAIAEFKTAVYTKGTKEEWGDEGTDEIPKHYLIQVAHYASVMDADTVHIGVLFGDEKLFNSYRKIHTLSARTQSPLSWEDLDDLRCDFKVYVYKRHGDLTRKLIKKERSFWFDHVLKNNPPAPQDGNIDDFLKAYPIANDRVVCVSEADMAKIQRLNEIKKQRRELDIQEASEKADILNLFGDSNVLVDENQNPLATWKNKSITRFDKASFAKAHPILCDTFSQTSTARELRLI